jgi:integrase
MSAPASVDCASSCSNASNAPINRELAALKRMFSLAIKDGKLHAKPYIPMLQEDNVRRGFFADQFATVKAHPPASLQAVVEFAYLTGWRVRSEVLPLEWRQVDWIARVVRLDPGTTKNREGRTFPFAAALEALLKTQFVERERLRQDDRIVRYVFHKEGEPIKSLRGAFQSACEAAGVRGRLLHDFRRTAVRNLERAGVPRSSANGDGWAQNGSYLSSLRHRRCRRAARAAAKIDEAAGTFSGTQATTEAPEAVGQSA